MLERRSSSVASAAHSWLMVECSARADQCGQNFFSDAKVSLLERKAKSSSRRKREWPAIITGVGCG